MEKGIYSFFRVPMEIIKTVKAVLLGFFFLYPKISHCYLLSAKMFVGSESWIYNNKMITKYSDIKCFK